jgi:precorrin-6B methylase 2
MKKPIRWICFVVLLLSWTWEACAQADPPKVDADFYQTGPRTRDGIGKYYMGREISQVMGHRGAGWLERKSREAEERTDLLLGFLSSLPGETVADIGAGTGYFTLPIAQRLASGQVLAVDLQPEMLNIVSKRADELGIDNIELIRGSVDNPNLPSGLVDIALLVDAYHEFSHPREMMIGIANGLRVGGRVVLVEYRGEDLSIPIKPLHKMTQKQAILELESVGLKWQSTEDFLPQQHVMIFTKPQN